MEKKYDFKIAEEAIRKLWRDDQVYQFDISAGPLYNVDTPPPTVSGSLHIGHIFSYTHTDIIVRYKRLSGYAVFYPFGFDDNGLPTERYVEKKLDITAHSMSRSEFINRCLQETVVAEEQFKDLWQKIGLSADWNKTYATIAPNARKISQESFILLYKKNYIYRQYEPALYCTTCRTSVAQAELDDSEKTALFNEIIFTTLDGQQLIIGTTRPELLSSCVALFYHPDDVRYQSLKNKRARVPIFNYDVPILSDELVDPEKGSGLVMCCTFGDKTDIYWFKKYKLPYKQSIGMDGKWKQETGPLAGLNAHQARAAVLELLEKQNLIKGQQSVTRSVNVHERCKKEIEYIALAQWFLKILPFKEELIRQGDAIEWYPAHMKTRYTNWVENLNWDWCLSRQRFYGIPFPVWYCENGHIVLAPLESLPIDPQESTYPGAKCDECNSTKFIPDTDVMDTWNTSSLTPQICFSLFNQGKHSPFDKQAVQEFLPMSMRPQAHDIIRTWAFYTIVKAWMHYELIPWKNIVISGHVLSDAHEKLSKSKGNALFIPENLLKTYAADAIRYWTASGRLGQDITFSENQLKIGQRLVVKLWNAFQFIVGHQVYDPTTTMTDVGVVNEWLLHAFGACFTEYKKYLEINEISLALDRLEQFFWNDFCDNYLEIIKDQLFHPDQYDSHDIEATRWTLSKIGFHILQLYAPYVPYVTEMIYQHLYKNFIGKKSIHLTQLPSDDYNYAESAQAMKIVMNVIAQIRKLKAEQQLSLKVPLKELIIYASPEIIKTIKLLEKIVKGITQAQIILYMTEKNSSVLRKIDDEWVGKINIE